MENIEFDVVIIGAGVVGCALAERISRKHKNILVLEKGPRIAEGVTSRNSGVIHAGIYYKPESLKASLCIRGNALLYEWCGKNQVPFKKCGKFIIASHSDECEELQNIYQNALDSGARGLSRQTKRAFEEACPEISIVDSLYSSESGIVDPTELTRSLKHVAEERGTIFSLNNSVLKIEKEGAYFLLKTQEAKIKTPLLVNSAGLYSDEISHFLSLETPLIYPYKGHYFKVKTQKKFEHLIYPVKKKNSPGLGIHLTIDLEGNLKLGPNVELTDSKENFSSKEELISEFFEAGRKLLGSLRIKDLSYDTCGIRPKIRSPLDKEEKDFFIEKSLPGFINLIGIESPGLTASLAIAEYVDLKFL